MVKCGFVLEKMAERWWTFVAKIAEGGGLQTVLALIMAESVDFIIVLTKMAESVHFIIVLTKMAESVHFIIVLTKMAESVHFIIVLTKMAVSVHFIIVLTRWQRRGGLQYSSEKDHGEVMDFGIVLTKMDSSWWTSAWF